MSQESGVLYVVATPIGNLADMSDRARHVLGRVDLIAAEDTRNVRRLLAHFQIRARVCAYHDHNEAHMAGRLLGMLERGKAIALVADAGTPLISDPGFALVCAAREQGFKVVSIPGANAAICALSASGLPCDRFLFVGFPPRNSPRRLDWLTELSTEPGTLVFYEAANRALATLQDMIAAFGAERRVVVARELTKRFETYLHGPLNVLFERLRGDPEQLRGEFVLMVAGACENDGRARQAEEERVLSILSEALPLKQAAALAARITGGRRNRLYRVALARQKRSDPP